MAFELENWQDGSARRYAPDGGGEPMFVVGVDGDGNEITERSNVIVPEDALFPAPVLAPEFPEKAVWTWDYTNPIRWNVYISFDGGINYQLIDWEDGDARRYAPDGGGDPLFIVGVDADGKEITERSNIIVPEDALMPAPVLVATYPDKAEWSWDLPDPYRWTVYLSFDGGISFKQWDWQAGDERRYAPDGGGNPMFIFGVDVNGKEITERSNVIIPDEAEPPATLLTDLTGYWPLDEGTDVTRLDATVNAQTLFDLNSDFPGGTGVVGGAATSDAEGLYRQLSADLAVPFSGTARSVSWWVNPSSAPSENFQIFLSLDGGDYTNDCVQCYAHDGGEFNVEFFGPWAAMIAVSVALIIQALVFGDGGITAIGANCFNMAVFMPFAAWYIFKLFGNDPTRKSRVFVAAFISGYLSLVLAAILTAIEFGIQPMIASTADGKALYCPYDLSIAIPAMAIEHLLIFGIAEGLITAFIIRYFLKNDPGLIYAFTMKERNENE